MSLLSEQPMQVNTESEVTKSDVAIVDDDPGFGFMLKDYLTTNSKFRCQLCKNGIEFLKEYKTGDTRKIILDYEFFEGPSGLEVLQRIRFINPLAIVIIASGQDDLEKAIETLRLGATDYFLKTNKTIFHNILCSLMKIGEMERNKWN